MEDKKVVFPLIIFLLIFYFLFKYYISDNHVIQAFTYLPLASIITFIYFVKYNIPLTYLFIPFVSAFTIFFLLLFLNMEYQYSKYFGAISDAQPGQITGAIMVIIAIIYIANNRKCNLSKVLMLILLVSAIQAYFYTYKEENDTTNIN